MVIHYYCYTQMSIHEMSFVVDIWLMFVSLFVCSLIEKELFCLSKSRFSFSQLSRNIKLLSLISLHSLSQIFEQVLPSLSLSSPSQFKSKLNDFDLKQTKFVSIQNVVMIMISMVENNVVRKNRRKSNH